MYVYNFRAEKLPKKYPTIKPKSNRFNMGILEVALKDEYMGETFGDDRMMKVRVCERLWDPAPESLVGTGQH